MCFVEGQQFFGPALLALAGSELSASKAEATLASRSPALARASNVSARDSSASLNSFLKSEVTLPGQFGLDDCLQAGNLPSLRCNEHRMVGPAILFRLLAFQSNAANF